MPVKAGAFLVCCSKIKENREKWNLKKGILLLFLHILRQMMVADKQMQLSDRHEECEADRFATKFINNVLQLNNECNDCVMKKYFVVLTYPRIMSIL